jgi:predicted NBD/HSP70 family sugar kinase/biotin operon repressor
VEDAQAVDVDQREDRARGLRRGSKQTGVRLYNERLVLSLIRQRRALPKAEIARLTGLSSTTISEIVQQLEADGLLIKEEPRRGRIGQPPVPLSLNPNGALSLGVKIGRRRCDILLMDFVGGVLSEIHSPYLYPRPVAVVDFIKQGCEALIGDLPQDSRSRMAGIGIAAPFELWNWEKDFGPAAGNLQEWREFDLRAEVARIYDLPVYLCNDGTAGCAAEYIFGHASQYQEFLYVFVAWFIGGGLVLNGNLFPGRSGYAGSLGQMLVPTIGADGRATVRQLLDVASISVLERRVREAGGDPRPIWDEPDWAGVSRYIDGWIEQVAEGIAYALVSAGSVVEFQAAIIDGAMPPDIRARIVARVKEKFDRLERTGLPEFAIVEGLIGYRARAIGGASLPLLAKFMRDRELLFHEPEDVRASNMAMHSARPSAF